MTIELVNSILDSLNIFTGMFCLLILIAQVRVVKKSLLQYLIIGLYGCYSIIILSFYFEVNRQIENFPFLIGISRPFQAFIPAIFYLYVKYITTPDFKFSNRYLLCFIPGIIYFLILIPSLFLREIDYKVSFIVHYNNYHPLILNLIFFTTVSFLFLILTIIEFRFLRVEIFKKNKSFKILLRLCTICIIGIILNCIGFIKGENIYLRLDTLFFNFGFIWLFLLSYEYPNFLTDISIKISKGKYKTSQLKGLNIEAVIKRLNELQMIEKIYTDPELNIERVSSNLEISKHQLSEILNSYMNINFQTYINKYRIEEAKQLLISETNLTILQIAYSVGFNSKTSFNNAFKKNTDQTPTEYRKIKK